MIMIIDNKKQNWIDFISEHLDEGAIRFDGLDDAIVGYDHRGLLVYSYSKMVDVFIKDQGMSAVDAIDWVDFNVTQTNAGIGFTILISTPDDC